MTLRYRFLPWQTFLQVDATGVAPASRYNPSFFLIPDFVPVVLPPLYQLMAIQIPPSCKPKWPDAQLHPSESLWTLGLSVCTAPGHHPIQAAANSWLCLDWTGTWLWRETQRQSLWHSHVLPTFFLTRASRNWKILQEFGEGPNVVSTWVIFPESVLGLGALEVAFFPPRHVPAVT